MRGEGCKAWPAGLQTMSEEDMKVAHRVGVRPLVQVSFMCKTYDAAVCILRSHGSHSRILLPGV